MKPAKLIALISLMAGTTLGSSCSQMLPTRNTLDDTILVTLETGRGEVEVALYPNRAPLSVAKFLSHVDAGDYDGASFYRATKIEGRSRIGVVQGGLAADAMSGPSEGVVDRYGDYGSVAHETTTQTGISNERGTLAYARFEPGTAGTEFFFNIDDNPGLDSGYTQHGRDGFGYATFGRVVRGQQVLDEIRQLPAEGKSSIEWIQGQLLTEPVVIRRAYRSAAQPG